MRRFPLRSRKSKSRNCTYTTRTGVTAISEERHNVSFFHLKRCSLWKRCSKWKKAKTNRRSRPAGTATRCAGNEESVARHLNYVGAHHESSALCIPNTLTEEPHPQSSGVPLKHSVAEGKTAPTNRRAFGLSGARAGRDFFKTIGRKVWPSGGWGLQDRGAKKRSHPCANTPLASRDEDIFLARAMQWVSALKNSACMNDADACVCAFHETNIAFLSDREEASDMLASGRQPVAYSFFCASCSTLALGQEWRTGSCSLSAYRLGELGSTMRTDRLEYGGGQWDAPEESISEAPSVPNFRAYSWHHYLGAIAPYTEVMSNSSCVWDVPPEGFSDGDCGKASWVASCYGGSSPFERFRADEMSTRDIDTDSQWSTLDHSGAMNALVVVPAFNCEYSVGHGAANITVARPSGVTTLYRVREAVEVNVLQPLPRINDRRGSSELDNSALLHDVLERVVAGHTCTVLITSMLGAAPVSTRVMQNVLIGLLRRLRVHRGDKGCADDIVAYPVAISASVHRQDCEALDMPSSHECKCSCTGRAALNGVCSTNQVAGEFDCGHMWDERDVVRLTKGPQDWLAVVPTLDSLEEILVMIVEVQLMHDSPFPLCTSERIKSSLRLYLRRTSAEGTNVLENTVRKDLLWTDLSYRVKLSVNDLAVVCLSSNRVEEVAVFDSITCRPSTQLMEMLEESAGTSHALSNFGVWSLSDQPEGGERSSSCKELHRYGRVSVGSDTGGRNTPWASGGFRSVYSMVPPNCCPSATFRQPTEQQRRLSDPCIPHADIPDAYLFSDRLNHIVAIAEPTALSYRVAQHIVTESNGKQHYLQEVVSASTVQQGKAFSAQVTELCRLFSNGFNTGFFYLDASDAYDTLWNSPAWSGIQQAIQTALLHCTNRKKLCASVAVVTNAGNMTDLLKGGVIEMLEMAWSPLHGPVVLNASRKSIASVEEWEECHSTARRHFRSELWTPDAHIYVGLAYCAFHEDNTYASSFTACILGSHASCLHCITERTSSPVVYDLYRTALRGPTASVLLVSLGLSSVAASDVLTCVEAMKRLRKRGLYRSGSVRCLLRYLRSCIDCIRRGDGLEFSKGGVTETHLTQVLMDHETLLHNSSAFFPLCYRRD